MIGYKNSNICLSQSKSNIERKIGELIRNVNGIHQDDPSIKEYIQIPNQIQLDSIILNPILYFSFNNDKLIYFSANFMIDNIEFDNRETTNLITKLCSFEITGAKELIDNRKTNIQNNKLLYIKSLKIDTMPQQFKRINYSIAAIP